MQKKLELVFATAAGAKKTIAVLNPREDLDKEQADKAMQDLLGTKVFAVNGAPLANPVEARIRTTDVTVLE